MKDVIAFQGIEGAHSAVAARKCYPHAVLRPAKTFYDALDSVMNDEAAFGFIPVENSSAGRVAEIHNLLPHYPLHIVAEYFHPVRHHLLGLVGARFEEIQTVYSHPQALMQCARHLKDYNLDPEPFEDTAAAARYVAESGNPRWGALAAAEAADFYGLEILKTNMQDEKTNRTLFISLSKTPFLPPLQAADRTLTSVLFTTRHISAGLYKALGGFATNNISLIKLESYIPNYNDGTAQFFMTVGGHPHQKTMKAAMEEFRFFTTSVRILGSYFSAEDRQPQKSAPKNG